MSDRRAYRRVTDDERNEMLALRAAGSSNADIALRLNRHLSVVIAQIGAAPKQPKVLAPCRPGVPVALNSRGQVLQRDTVRTVWNDYALPPGHSATWGCISANPFTPGL